MSAETNSTRAGAAADDHHARHVDHRGGRGAAALDGEGDLAGSMPMYSAKRRRVDEIGIRARRQGDDRVDVAGAAVRRRPAPCRASRSCSAMGVTPVMRPCGSSAMPAMALLHIRPLKP